VDIISYIWTIYHPYGAHAGDAGVILGLSHQRIAQLVRHS
jgi:hypothetical protein